ncbi:LacI family DNA-binding transcriptional regulator [Leifsonia shinshuensis]|uniref:DNA-binding LacI/PurR family transcriptional regulator n=1 Tax=Leifsonia shinshuensis TaxID=150026 RepID=A0A853D2Q4_9MICO|nr:LacI family DNA-binding transcriptional regulator [Leifsonia shinshuensis]NYJ25721.1 DNA-binding LacI/PurR family transcriptional regulator [Leifsonia shinshuensis]
MVTRRVTLADVSKEAGVGIATVSRALAPQDHPDVSAETRSRIRAVADRLGYRPSVTARALRTSDYHAVSILLPEGIWGWWDPAVRGATAAADRLGYRVLVQQFANPEHTADEGLRTLPYAGPSNAAAIVASLVEVPTEGLLIFGSADDTGVAEAARRLRLPIMTVDDVAQDLVLPTIVTDSRVGAREGVEHLIGLGRRKIAYVGSQYDAFYVKERLLGYRDALAGAGIPFREELVIPCAYTIDESRRTYPEFDRFLESEPDIDAIFCEADEIAAPVLRSLRAAGRSVPDEISVVGFDDDRPAVIVDPPLTTVRQPYEELGRRALDALLRLIAGDTIPIGRELVPPSIVVRDSTAPAG